jgi:hypothetical protein
MNRAVRHFEMSNIPLLCEEGNIASHNELAKIQTDAPVEILKS